MSEKNSSNAQLRRSAATRLLEHWEELYAALQEKEEWEMGRPNDRATVHALIRRHFTAILKKLEASEERESFLLTGFSPAQFRKAALYGMLYAARKYKPESGKEERQYLYFYARQEILRQCVNYSHCFCVNPETGKSFCTIPAFDRDFRRSGGILFQRRGREAVDGAGKTETGPSENNRQGSDFSGLN